MISSRRRFNNDSASHTNYTQYLELLDQVASNNLFDRWCGYRNNNKKVSPVELLVLGSLCYLCCGWTFDDCEELTAIDKGVLVFF
jgi:hypothetical protein